MLDPGPTRVRQIEEQKPEKFPESYDKLAIRSAKNVLPDDVFSEAHHCARSWFEALYESQLDERCEQPLPGVVLEFWQEKGYHATMRDGVIVLAPCTPLVPSTLDFEKAPSFQGVRAGWCFKMGPHGLGYYRDLEKQVVVELDDLRSLHRDCEVDQSSDSSIYHFPISDDDGDQFIATRAYGNEFLDMKEREYRELERQELLREMMLVGELLGPPPPLPPLPTPAVDRDDT